jgi:hypothetical protein
MGLGRCALRHLLIQSSVAAYARNTAT